MGFFEKILGKQIDLGEQMPIYFVSSDEDYMQRAFEQARESFKYFWRELYWERRRIAPMLDYAMVKICFLDVINGEEVGEHMWVNDVEFDGETIYGTLVNEPDSVQNVKVGDQISAKFTDMSDWLFAIGGRAYGGFSVQAMRSRMQKDEQYIKAHPSMVSDTDELGFTQLHHEALAGNLTIVNLLLENGASKNARTKSGKTAAELAKQIGWSEIAKVLK